MSPAIELNTKFFCVFLVFISLCIIVAQRSHTIDEPLERDITTYSVIGHEMLNGRMLYSDLWDHKPPAVHVTFAIGELIAGYGSKAIFLLGLNAAVLSLVGFVAAVIWAGGNYFGAGLVAILWSLAGSDLYLQANQPNTEVFLNAFLLWGIALSLRIASKGMTLPGSLLAALCWGIASLYKMVVITIPALIVPITAIMLYRRGTRRHQLFWFLAIQLLVGEILWLGIAEYFFLAGHLTDFYEIVIQYNQDYVRNYGQILAGFFRLETWMPLWQGTGWILAAGAVVGIFSLVLKRNYQLLLYIIAYLAGAAAAVAWPGHYYPHYLQLLLPPLVLAVGLGFSNSLFTPHWSWEKWIAGGILLVVLLGMTIKVKDQLSLAPAEWSRLKYPDGEIFITSVALGEWLRTITKPNEPIYEFGAETGIYFYSQRSPAAGIFYDFPFFSGPYQDRYIIRVIEKIMASPPRVIIFKETYYKWLFSKQWKTWRPSAWKKLFQFVEDEYILTRMDEKVRPLAVYMRKDSI